MLLQQAGRGRCMHGWGLADSAKRAEQAVKQLTEAVASMPEDACSDLLILPLYAAMPLELQVSCSLPSPSPHLAQCWPMPWRSWLQAAKSCLQANPSI